MYASINGKIPEILAVYIGSGNVSGDVLCRGLDSKSRGICTYTITIAGNYLLAVNGISLFGGPYNLTVMPSFVYRDVSFDSNQEIMQYMTAGERQSFRVVIRDIWWNAVDYTLRVLAIARNTKSVQRDVLCSASILSKKETLHISLILTAAGTYAIHLKSLIGNGLAASYFPNSMLQYSELSQTDDSIDFSLATSSSLFPLTSQSASFSARWSGCLRPRSQGLMTFSLRAVSSTERTKMWIDNLLIIDQWSSLNSTSSQGTLSFADANTYHDFVVEYKQLNSTKRSGLQLLWADSYSNFFVIPSDRIFVAQDFVSGAYVVELFPTIICSSTSYVVGANQTIFIVGQVTTFSLLMRDSFSNPTNVSSGSRLALVVKDAGSWREDAEEILGSFDEIGTWNSRFLVKTCGVFAIQAMVMGVPFIQATYYSDFLMEIPVMNTNERSLNFDWGLSGPLGSRVDYFSSKWTGNIRVNTTGYYSLLLLADDCATLYVSQSRILDSCTESRGVRCRDCADYPAEGRSASIFLQTGALYAFEVHHFETTGNSLCKLQLSKGTSFQQIVGFGLVSSNQALSSILSVSVWSDRVRKGGCIFPQGTMTLATSGIISSMSLVCRDSYENLYRAAPELKSPILSGIFRKSESRDVHLNWTYEGQGVFSLSYLPRLIGAYQIQLYAFIPGLQGLSATYYEAHQFNNFAIQNTLSETSAIRYFSANFSLLGVGNMSNFGMRWSGLLLSSIGGQYTFVTSLNSEDKVKLWVDNQILIDGWSSLGQNGFGVLQLDKSVYYCINLELEKSSSGGVLNLQWQFQGQSLVTIPQSHLFTSEDAFDANEKWVQVVAGEVCSSQTSASGIGLTISTASIPALFIIRPRDAGGNVLLRPSSDLIIRIVLATGATMQSLYLQDQLEAPCLVNYTMKSQVNYWIFASFLRNGGLTATYYENDSWLSPSHVKTDYTVDFSGASTFFPWLKSSVYRARWSGFLRPNIFQVYSLYTSVLATSERVKLWVDNMLIIDQWTSLAATLRSATVLLSVGQVYFEFRLEYKHPNLTSISGLSLSWSSADTHDVAMEIVPSISFYVGFDIMGSPFTARCLQCSQCICSTASMVQGSALSVVTAGIRTTFRIFPRDSLGFPLDLERQLIYTSIYGPTNVNAYSASIPKSTRLPVECYGIECVTVNQDFEGWMVTQSGQYLISIISVQQGGLYATYYADENFRSASISFNTKNLEIAPNRLFLSARWFGFFIVQASEVFTFHTNFKCGSSQNPKYHFLIAIDSNVMLDFWGNCDSEIVSETSASIMLRAGALHEISILYQRSNFEMDYILKWTSASSPKSTENYLYFPKDHVSGSPFQSTAVPGPICSALTTVEALSSTIFTAGNPVVFSIQARDAYGNKRIVDSATVCVFSVASGVRNTHVDSLGLDNDYTTATLLLTRAGYAKVFGVSIEMQGLSATYFSTDQFSSPLLSQIDTNIDFSTALLCLNIAEHCDEFSVRWSGFLFPRTSKVQFTKKR